MTVKMRTFSVTALVLTNLLFPFPTIARVCRLGSLRDVCGSRRVGFAGVTGPIPGSGLSPDFCL